MSPARFWTYGTLPGKKSIGGQDVVGCRLFIMDLRRGVAFVVAYIYIGVYSFR